MILPENMARFLAAMQESVVSAAAAAAAAANQNSGGGNGNSGPTVNGINSSSGGNSGNNNVNITGNENSSSVTSNNNINNNNNASSSASSTPNPSQMMQQHHHNSNPSSSSPTLSHQLNQPQLNHHHQPLNFANISSLVQQPLVSSGGSPNHTKSPPPANQPPTSGIMGNHSGGSLYGTANALLKSAKARSAGKYKKHFFIVMCVF